MADPGTQEAQGRGAPPRPGERPAEGEGRSRGGCLIPLALAAGWFFLLRDFTSMPVAAVLAVVGGGLAQAGTYLTLGGLRYVLEGPWYALLVPIGVVLLAGAAATLSPAAPGELLAERPSGWALLEHRIDRLEDAMDAGDTSVAKKLASRGLGDPAAVDRSGTPLLHLARDREMLAALLEAGLDPDAAGAGGQTLLMRTNDPEVARLLLEAGADPDVRTDNGFTALMMQGDRLEVARLILEAGADVHAVTDSGRTVADLVGGPARALLPEYAGGRPLRETGGVTPRGRDDWLVTRPDDRAARSGVTLTGEDLRPGDVGTLRIVLDNPSPADRVLEVRAALQSGLLLLHASHDGTLETRGRPGLVSTVRWPWLSLPAGAQGQLELEVIVQPDDVITDVVTGDLGMDVRILDLPERTEQALRFSQERAGPAARAQPDDPAFYGPLVVAFAVVGVSWLVFGRRRRGERETTQQIRIARVVLVGCAALCAGLSVDILWSMIEPGTSFEETSCEIRDRRVVVTEVTSSTGSTRTGGTIRSTTTLQGHPVAAVAIGSGAERRYAVGFSSGFATRSTHELRRFAVGSTVPCWFDPDRPDRFTLVRDTPVSGVVFLVIVLGLTPLLLLLASRVGGIIEPPKE